jgi:hypothetical protein
LTGPPALERSISRKLGYRTGNIALEPGPGLAMKHEISLVGFVVLLSAGQSFAGPPRDPWSNPYADISAAPRRPMTEKERLALIEKGKGLTREGKYPEALQVLREALEARPDPRVLLWAGYAQEQTGTLLAARASYLEAKSVAHAGKLTGEERNADQALLEIGAKIPRIKVTLPSGVEAKIRIDGKAIQPPTEGVEVDPGNHSVIASGPGLHPYRIAVVAKLGEVHVVEPTLTRIPPPPPAPPPAPPEKTASDPPLGALVIAGIATTSLGMTMGTGFAIASEVKRSERDAHIDVTRGCHGLTCEPYNAPERARASFLNVSAASFIVAGAVGAGTLTYALVTRAKKTRSEATATVSAGPGGVAGVVSFTW